MCLYTINVLFSSSCKTELLHIREKRKEKTILDKKTKQNEAESCYKSKLDGLNNFNKQIDYLQFFRNTIRICQSPKYFTISKKYYSAPHAKLIQYDDLYRVYKRPKKNGTYRIITQPNDDLLKKIQRELFKFFRFALELQDEKSKLVFLSDGVKRPFQYGASSFGFERGKSIVDNADLHAGNQFFFKTDIKHFFDSFTVGMVKKTVSKAMFLYTDLYNEFMSYNSGFISEKDPHFMSELELYLRFILNDVKKILNNKQSYINWFTALLCYKGKLATGTCVSPLLANLYMRPFDLSINIWLKNLEIKTGQVFTYSRYADDICISSKQPIPNKVIKHVDKKLKEFGLTMNKAKTVLQTYKQKNVITGINITSTGSLTVGRKKKELVKKMLHESLKEPEDTSKETYPALTVLGNLSYLKYVEPEYYKKMVRKYVKAAGYDLNNIASNTIWLYYDTDEVSSTQSYKMKVAFSKDEFRNINKTSKKFLKVGCELS